ncbi:hypothetical protein OAI02_04445 [Candidatus Pseudothioglobus singularis]|nr:hypothetical protein [Candidatus Pseudothioglobus singularis]MDB4847728.1 hypothetical protein [Candidatus Pseudothioglobus singularis]
MLRVFICSTGGISKIQVPNASKSHSILSEGTSHDFTIHVIDFRNFGGHKKTLEVLIGSSG